MYKLDTLPEQLFYSTQAAATPTSPAQRHMSEPFENSAAVPTRPTPARLNARALQTVSVGSIEGRPSNNRHSSALPHVPLVIDISKETCYDYDYDTHVYTPSVERSPDNSCNDGRISPSSEARGTYYASSWSGSLESLTEGMITRINYFPYRLTFRFYS